ncbi:DNA-binding PadR family transcriptional regulator [Arthrobacter stackebrandtii]|uniref:DNA-binding PadR family transcriptional regulator n=1 Tax=Arthrobacter stackebrandtii TaxID=272161 RepID=A0ABS4YZH6_9MICC|nr:PadR family transcriptional regulator [Arthrobacter stackebrandtii]MBP2413870.1 DNA-binding PadR family transcriptional regulator [Arthrobacter stackebrandtii]PYH00442.1 PadR family transcriptional regulator [Arthrobacter stackebrandtii]
MSVKHALLALLSWKPSTMYQLRKDFDASTGETWPLNIGQVSTTLQRLERDGLVEQVAALEGEPEPWRLTAGGLREVQEWWHSPVPRETPGRDELVIKLALAVTVPGVDVAELVQRQRSATLRVLHDITKVRRGVDEGDIAVRLVLDNHIFTTEAELRWLDDVEGTLLSAQARATADGTVAQVPAEPQAQVSAKTVKAGGKR